MTVNYTDEQTQKLVQLYLAGETVETLAEIFDKPKRSIIGKLSKEGVYVKKVYKTKAGTDPITKKEMIFNMATLIGADPEKLQGLEKAPKIELQYLCEVLEEKHNGNATS